MASFSYFNDEIVPFYLLFFNFVLSVVDGRNEGSYFSFTANG